ncbi:hypothetical protein TURU_119487 [Turdus rufiventris]|nr:hypothetical protein TURU_119487 [Turdus rufiventris]
MEASGGTGAAAVLGETGLAVSCCIAAALSWERPLRSLGGFVCANLLFCWSAWFVVTQSLLLQDWEQVSTPAA